MRCTAYTLAVLAIALVCTTSAAPARADYDPLRRAAGVAAVTTERVVRDEKRQRDIPIRIYLPDAPAAAPVVLFSHGLGGARTNNAYLGEHWAARGYVAVFLQHPGSDASVWQDVAPARRRAALKEAADLESFIDRTRDVPAVLDALQRWQDSADDPLRGRFDLGRIGMSGHSFGALTTQAVSGQRFMRGRRNFTDTRIDAALMMSPNAPTRGGGPAAAFAQVGIPWLLMTGTLDSSPIGAATVASRLAVFPALPRGLGYELVLDRAEHSAFGDRALPDDREPRNPNHHRAILALSTAFWDAHLRSDRAARRWLESEAATRVLEAGDRWRWN
jgi:predicted dienelactone hydrolase